MCKKVVTCSLAFLMVLVVAAPLALCATTIISSSFDCWSSYTSPATYSLTQDTHAGCQFWTHAYSRYTGSGTPQGGDRYYNSYIKRDAFGAFKHGFSNVIADGTIYKKAFGNPITSANYYFTTSVHNTDNYWRISGTSRIVRP